MKTALIAGATGLVGKQLLDMLLQADRYFRVIALTRTALSVSHPRLTNIVSDFAQLEKGLAGIEADDVFCCLGTTMAKAKSRERFYEVDFKYPLNLARTTRVSGASQFLLVSALGSDKRSGIYYNRVKGELEEAVMKVGFDALHIFRPSLLLGPRAEKRTGEDVAKWVYRVFSFAVPAKYKAIPSEKVARSMLLSAAKDLKGTFIYESRDMHQV